MKLVVLIVAATLSAPTGFQDDTQSGQFTVTLESSSKHVCASTAAHLVRSLDVFSSWKDGAPSFAPALKFCMPKGLYTFIVACDHGYCSLPFNVRLETDCVAPYELQRPVQLVLTVNGGAKNAKSLRLRRSMRQFGDLATLTPWPHVTAVVSTHSLQKEYPARVRGDSVVFENLPWGHYALESLDAPGVVFAVQLLPGDEVRLEDVELKPREVCLDIKDRDGRPVERATIKLVDPTGVWAGLVDDPFGAFPSLPAVLAQSNSEGRASVACYLGAPLVAIVQHKSFAPKCFAVQDGALHSVTLSETGAGQVQVLDAFSREPVQHASLRLEWKSECGVELTEDVTTDEKGLAVVPIEALRTGRLSALSPEYPPLEVVFVGAHDARTATVELPSGVALEIIVSSVDGDPVAGVLVSVEVQTGAARARTDQEGLARFGAVFPFGPQKVQFNMEMAGRRIRTERLIEFQDDPVRCVLTWER